MTYNKKQNLTIIKMFILENEVIAHGDCAAVQYSGAGGRDPLFLAADFIPVIEKEIAPLYEGKEISYSGKWQTSWIKR